MNVFEKIVEKYCKLPRRMRRPMWQIWHKIILRFDKDVNANFMNYGYAESPEAPKIDLKKEDEINRYCIQLYDRVVREGEIKDQDVLEVGSGRGGGASYISRYYKPKSYTAMDISSNVVDFCNKHYDVEGLIFKKGFAEDLPFKDNSFDRVVNVESARCYHDIQKFFREVHRVLRPGGYFLFADMIEPAQHESIQEKLGICGFEDENKADITKNVVKALDKDSRRREDIVDDIAPGFLKKAFLLFAGAKGTPRYESFTNGQFHYWYHKLKKSD